MKLSKIFSAFVLFGMLWFTGCKPKDADIKSAIEARINANPDAAGAIVDVKDGVVTLSGQVKDDLSKDKVGGLLQDIKGIKSIDNNITVAPVPTTAVAVDTTASVLVAADDALSKGIKDATKDFPSVTAAVKDGIISLSGTIKKEALPKLMMALSSLHPKKIDNRLTVN